MILRYEVKKKIETLAKGKLKALRKRSLRKGKISTNDSFWVKQKKCFYALEASLKDNVTGTQSNKDKR